VLFYAVCIRPQNVKTPAEFIFCHNLYIDLTFILKYTVNNKKAKERLYDEEIKIHKVFLLIADYNFTAVSIHSSLFGKAK